MSIEEQIHYSHWFDRELNPFNSTARTGYPVGWAPAAMREVVSSTPVGSTFRGL